MNVILLKDVEKLGIRGSVVKVKRGYARNYLVPSGFAVVETEQQRRALGETIRQGEQKHKRDVEKAEGVKKVIESKKWTLTLNVGTEDKTFGAVTANDVAELLEREGIAIEKHSVHLSEPIKSLGVHVVPVRVHSEVTASLKLSVVKA